MGRKESIFALPEVNASIEGTLRIGILYPSTFFIILIEYSLSNEGIAKSICFMCPLNLEILLGGNIFIPSNFLP